MSEGTQGPDGGTGAAVGTRPQHLLLTLLGDFWYSRTESLPSTALVRLLAEFGVTEPNARAAISRLARKDLLVATRQGRRTAYALSETGHATLVEGTRRIFRFGSDPQPWDGRWTMVAFSVPEEHRSLRSTLRTRLRWLGFTALFDGVWVAPGDHAEEGNDLLGELALTTATIVVGTACGPRDGDPARAWDLQHLGEAYHRFLGDFGGVPDRVRAGEVTDAEALVLRTTLIDVWRTFPALDPELPAELLPGGWPAHRARELFTDVYDTLGPQATGRFRELVAVDDPAAAQLARHHTSTEALAEA
ncbi:PaaX family transcriptional regulator C-terminal domain-containing protein [Geodermatophilus sp. CPCC 206100]|uniref:PaaX family transcriptional regulator n=1 Tax=Geodermatophilus sp. CPCC 206100 TaxID=3020054 RepID=UPI003B001C26